MRLPALSAVLLLLAASPARPVVAGRPAADIMAAPAAAPGRPDGEVQLHTAAFQASDATVAVAAAANVNGASAAAAFVRFPAEQPSGAAPAGPLLLPLAHQPRWCDPSSFQGRPKQYLYVWAGIARARSNDFVATIDTTEGSPCFGKVIHEAEVPTAGNEPHHAGLNINGTVLGVGGFNSWRRNQPSIYLFNTTDSARPTYIKALTPKEGAVADDLIRMPNGGFLASLMANTAGGSSGRVAEISPSLELIAEHPLSKQNVEGFNPHGLALTPASLNRFVTLDYLEYRTTFKPYAKPLYRTTARIWDQAKREIIKVVDLGPQAKGLMTARYLARPNSTTFLITAGHGVLYALDTSTETAKPVFDFNIGEGHCVLTAPFKNNTRMLASLYTSDQLQLLDISDLTSIKRLQNVDLPKGTGPHATVLAPDQKTVAISTYYVQHARGEASGPPFDNVNERAVRLYVLSNDSNSFAPHPVTPFINFKRLFPHRGVARPHGMVFKSVA